GRTRRTWRRCGGAADGTVHGEAHRQRPELYADLLGEAGSAAEISFQLSAFSFRLAACSLQLAACSFRLQTFGSSARISSLVRTVEDDLAFEKIRSTSSS